MTDNQNTKSKELLLIGIGNNARADDGLGWKFLDDMDSYRDVCDIEYCYQLQVEDASLVSAYDVVVFVDASEKPLEDGFAFTPCTSNAGEHSFTSHQLTPSAVLWLCQELYSKAPQAHLLAIQGTSWDLHEGLSKEAEFNLSKAITFFIDLLSRQLN